MLKLGVFNRVTPDLRHTILHAVVKNKAIFINVKLVEFIMRDAFRIRIGDIHDWRAVSRLTHCWPFTLAGIRHRCGFGISCENTRY